MNPLVSILIPAYNAEEWIADTVRSALAQTWPNKEIIVVDDGSTDQTLSVARQFVSETVRVVTQENQGAAAARNRAFALCQGDYIQWLDADDLLAPDKITTQMKAFTSGTSDRKLLSGAWAYFMYRPQKAKFIPSALWCDLSPVEWLVRKMAYNLHMQTATWLVSRELTEAAGPWDTRLMGDDDGEYFCRVLMAGQGVHFVREARVYYRLAPGSWSYIGQSERKLVAQFESMKLHISYLRSLEDSERVRTACVTYLQNWLPKFYPERPDLLNQLEQLAETFGGRLKPPKFSWKYSWIEKTFSYSAAKRAQLSYNQWKASSLRAFDKFLLRLERRECSGQLR